MTALQEMEQAGVQPMPLKNLSENQNADHADVDIAVMLAQLTSDSSIAPTHLVMLEMIDISAMPMTSSVMLVNARLLPCLLCS